MSRVGGTPREVTLAGVPYDVMGSCNISLMPNEYENDAIPTSGKPIQKKTKRVPKAESVILGVSIEELQTLVDSADSLDKINFSIKFAGEDVIRSKGQINIESYESEECACTVILLPDEKWKFFAA